MAGILKAKGQSGTKHTEIEVIGEKKNGDK